MRHQKKFHCLLASSTHRVAKEVQSVINDQPTTPKTWDEVAFTQRSTADDWDPLREVANGMILMTFEHLNNIYHNDTCVDHNDNALCNYIPFQHRLHLL